ncbi:MAG TPA: AraC family transcriptional regulator [Pilimelia sp.]|nr:AraC family transcriptional regulator [Pilimelia sp.]
MVVGTGQHTGAPPATRPVVRATTLRELPHHTRSRPSRLDRHELLLVTAGHGVHMVDFVAQPCRPGTLIWVRPGQVIGYGGQPGLDAILVSWPADLFASLRIGAPALADPFGPTRWQLGGEDGDAIVDEVSQLVVDIGRHDAGGLPPELLGHQLAVLLLRIALLPPEPGADRWETPATGDTTGGVFRRFRSEVERSYTATRRVEDYAARLGCSVRTLTRASLAATGRTAKQLVDDRVALEARRLLAGTSLPVAEVGQRLGFAEPTNFGRFFHREVGCSPGAFRAAVCERPPPGPPPGESALPGPGPSGSGRCGSEQWEPARPGPGQWEPAPAGSMPLRSTPRVPAPRRPPHVEAPRRRVGESPPPPG